MSPSGFGAGCFGPRASFQPDMVYSHPQRTEQHPIFFPRTHSPGKFCFAFSPMLSARLSAPPQVPLSLFSASRGQVKPQSESDTEQPQQLPHKAFLEKQWNGQAPLTSTMGRFWAASHMCHGSLPCATALLRATHGSSAAISSPPTDHTNQCAIESCKTSLSVSPYLWLLAVCFCSISRE